MSPHEFFLQVSDFYDLSPRDQIRLVSWYLHVHGGAEVLINSIVRDCFRQINAQPPDVSVYMPRIAAMKPADLIRVKGGYKLARGAEAIFRCKIWLAS